MGDHNMKKVGVITDPVITHHAVEERDEFLIIASDGIWEFIDSSEAVMIVGNCFDKAAQQVRRASN
jgi:serine/threonine protein phosphatase PrpC